MVKIDWKQEYQVGEFACPNPNCHARDVRLEGHYKKSKRKFRCNVCGSTTIESIELTPWILSHQAGKLPSIKSFFFEDNQWDLRAINSSFDNQERKIIANFDNVQPPWFRFQVKQYIYYLCKLNKPFNTIEKDLCSLRAFSRYLSRSRIAGIKGIKYLRKINCVFCTKVY